MLLYELTPRVRNYSINKYDFVYLYEIIVGTAIRVMIQK